MVFWRAIEYKQRIIERDNKMENKKKIGRVVWTPHIHTKGVDVLLDKDFARECLDCSVGKDRQKEIRKAAWGMYGLGPEGSVTPTDLFGFFEDSLLLSRIYKPNSNGVWLETDASRWPRENDQTLLYQSHNADLSISKLWLLRSFYVWEELVKTWMYDVSQRI